MVHPTLKNKTDTIVVTILNCKENQWARRTLGEALIEKYNFSVYDSVVIVQNYNLSLVDSSVMTDFSKDYDYESAALKEEISNIDLSLFKSLAQNYTYSIGDAMGTDSLGNKILVALVSKSHHSSMFYQVKKDLKPYLENEQGVRVKINYVGAMDREVSFLHPEVSVENVGLDKYLKHIRNKYGLELEQTNTDHIPYKVIIADSVLNKRESANKH